MDSILSQIPMLRGLNEVALARVAACGVTRHCERGEAIIWAQDECEYVYFILEGQVEVYRHAPGGREQMLDRLGTGDCFNLVPASLGTTHNLANVRALTKSRLLALEVREFTRLVETEPRLALNVVRFLASRLEYMTRLVESLSLYSVRQRLARFLMDQADRGSAQEGARWTQTDMANRLGTVRDVLGRALRRLADEGALRIERDSIILLDRAKLEKAVEGDE